jgi:hypothetical protein
MITISVVLLGAIGAGIVLLAVVALLVIVRLRGARPAGTITPEARGDLLHNGLRAQATITDVRATGGGRVYVTSASGIDPVSGKPKTYIQRGARSIGRRGEPVTVLVDAARPHIYLIVP